MKLSVHDKNLIGLLWLLEVTLTSIVKMNMKLVPDSKASDYAAIQERLKPALEEVIAINNEFEHDISATLGESFITRLADTINAVITLLETMPAKAVRKTMLDGGIDGTAILNNYRENRND